MQEQSLNELVGAQILGILGAYPQSDSQPQKMDVYVCGVEVQSDTQLNVFFPKGHSLHHNQYVTLHLDNRTGVSEYDAELKVNRLSFKGIITQINDTHARIEAIEYQVFYGISVVKAFQQSHYTFPEDARIESPLPLSPLSALNKIDAAEHDNKIGVLLTIAEQQPHTTVMAFLSTEQDDIFFITFPSTFKSKLLKRDNHCYFAIDSRATFTFEHAIEWNYSIIEGKVFQIPKTSALFEQVKELFVLKNPWEVGFFMNPEVELYHLQPQHVVCPKQGE